MEYQEPSLFTLACGVKLPKDRCRNHNLTNQRYQKEQSKTSDKVTGNTNFMEGTKKEQRLIKCYTSPYIQPYTFTSGPTIPSHFLIGIVKKHHELLKRACHTLDTQIASTLAKETDTLYENTTPFGQYVNRDIK